MTVLKEATSHKFYPQILRKLMLTFLGQDQVSLISKSLKKPGGMPNSRCDLTDLKWENYIWKCYLKSQALWPWWVIAICLAPVSPDTWGEGWGRTKGSLRLLPNMWFRDCMITKSVLSDGPVDIQAKLLNLFI